ncbi:sacsin N-terminal ATP-binding-like domain-containing protein [Actinocatenispora comari]|uniref:Molecular chaperone Hsp90 n=1 Tax=Actinocatenispora comari TaxID=2807577 RepID=A0A8J4ADU2_9ACTN|nr:hypothetical protein [Actinocatenispora comari]GIL29771.1 hypothetical protein NUM_50250 [Actinocatenispora comari]
MSDPSGADGSGPTDPVGAADPSGAVAARGDAGSSGGGADPFGTAARRDAIRAAWAASPTRFREDANAEEDLYLGGYADRLLVELAQNAADAAARAGVPGRLRLRLVSTVDGGVALSAANTGEPLTAAGIDALTSLRASAKRDGAGIGRFGVGFAAVLAVSDEPQLRSTRGGVRFSAVDTTAVVADVPHLAEEARHRGGRVPVLRLAWPVDAAPPDGYATEVLLPLRDDAALAEVRTRLADFDPALLLGLPQLSTVDMDGRVVTRAAEGTDVLLTDDGRAQRWRTATAAGIVPAELLADRPVEERARTDWSVLAAVPIRPAEPVDGSPGGTGGPGERTDRGPSAAADAGGWLPVPVSGQVVHAPTPTDEPVGLPVRLIASFPLTASRRTIPAGPLTDFVLDRCAAVYAELVAGLAGTPAVRGLLPPAGFPPGPLADALRTAGLAALRERDLLPTADGGRTRPDRAVAVPDPLVPALTGLLADLLPAGWWHRDLAALGTRRLETAEIVAVVTGLHRPAGWWHDLYAGFGALTLETADREALAALPVPLADGRTVTGPARVLLPDDTPPPAGLDLNPLGLLVADPDAAHPLLARLGARPATPSDLLRDERVRAAVDDSLDAEEPAPVAAAVLALVEAAGTAPGELPWLSDLALPGRPLDDPDAEPDWYPAGELLSPAGPLPDLFVPDAPFGVLDGDLADRYRPGTLAAVGVLTSFEVVDEHDVDLVDLTRAADLAGAADLVGAADGDAVGADLVEVDRWAAAVERIAADVDPVGLRIDRLRGIRDLDLVRPDRWPAALALLTAPPLAAVLAADGTLRTAAGEAIPVPGYQRWWLARQPVLDGRRPIDTRLPGDSELAGLYDPAPGPAETAALLGAYGGLAELLDAAEADPDVAADLLDRLGDPDRSVAPELLAVLYPRLAAVLDPEQVPPPARIRVAPDRTVPAADAVVLDRPWLLDRLAGRHPVPGGGDPVAVADLLDLPLLSELPEPNGSASSRTDPE